MSGRAWTQNRLDNDEMRQGVFATKQEQIDVLGTATGDGGTATISLAHADNNGGYPLHGNTDLKLWSYASGEDLAAGSSNIEVKFWRRLDGASTLYQVGSAVTISSKAATAATADSIDVTGQEDTATHVSFAGDVTVADGCTATIVLGKTQAN